MKVTSSSTTTKIAKHEFDLLRPLENSRTELKQATADDIDKVYDLSKNAIPGNIAHISLIKKIVAHNSDNAFISQRKMKNIGIYAMLMLTPLGLERLLLGGFNGQNPDLLYLAKSGEKPAAIYMWGTIAPGLAADGIRYVSQYLQEPKYRNVNLYSRPNTEAGVRINISLGFQPVKKAFDGLYRYERLVNREPNLQRVA